MKGTGLSGYVQRSRATVHSSLSRFRPSPRAVGDGEGGGASPAESVNPLLAKRSQRENDELARRLDTHKAIRAVALRVLLYREDRLTGGVDAATVERECAELKKSLMQAALAEQQELRRAEEEKTVERFAAAFGVRPSDGQSFDRARHEEDRHAMEQERRRLKEQQLVERLKRIRQEEEEKTLTPNQ